MIPYGRQDINQADIDAVVADQQAPVDQVHVRLDQFLAGRLKWRSRTSVQRLIKDGYLLVDAIELMRDGKYVIHF